MFSEQAVRNTHHAHIFQHGVSVLVNIARPLLARHLDGKQYFCYFFDFQPIRQLQSWPELAAADETGDVEVGDVGS